MTYALPDPFKRFTLRKEDFTQSEAVAIDIMNQFLKAVGSQMPVYIERWPVDDFMPRTAFLTYTDVTYLCFGYTVIESLSITASYILGFTLRGAIVSTVWTQRLIDAGLQIASREELERENCGLLK